MNANRIPRLLASLTLAAAAPAAAGLPQPESLTGAFAGSTGCHHVLALVARYCPIAGLPTPMGDSAVPSPWGPFFLPAEEIGDIEIVGLTESAAGDPSRAPTVLVAVTNRSTRAVRDLSVSVVALLGPIRPFDPTANACVEEIPPGATVEVALTLPVEALAMGSNGGGAVGFQELLVAVDSYDRLLESDELNNIRLFSRSEIARQIVEPVALEPGPVALTPSVAPSSAPQAPNPSALDTAIEEFGLEAKPDQQPVPQDPIGDPPAAEQQAAPQPAPQEPVAPQPVGEEPVAPPPVAEQQATEAL